MTEQSALKPVDLNADQALGMVSFGLMQRLAQDGQVDLPWLEASEMQTVSVCASCVNGWN